MRPVLARPSLEIQTIFIALIMTIANFTAANAANTANVTNAANGRIEYLIGANDGKDLERPPSSLTDFCRQQVVLPKQKK